jgi:hypothetical protein
LPSRNRPRWEMLLEEPLPEVEQDAKYMNIPMRCVCISDHNNIEQQYVNLIPLSGISILVLERHWSIFVKIIKS